MNHSVCDIMGRNCTKHKKPEILAMFSQRLNTKTQHAYEKINEEFGPVESWKEARNTPDEDRTTF